MKTLFKSAVATCALVFAYSSFALTLAPPQISPISPGGQSVAIGFSDMGEVIDSTAEETLNPGGSETKSNCRTDAHCVVLPYNNNCNIVNFSTYKSRGAESAISDLVILHDLNLANDAVCARAVTEGSCVDKRCAFEETGGIAF